MMVQKLRKSLSSRKLYQGLYENLKYANLQNNVEICNHQEGLEKDEFLDAHDNCVSSAVDSDI